MTQLSLAIDDGFRVVSYFLPVTVGNNIVIAKGKKNIHFVKLENKSDVNLVLG